MIISNDKTKPYSKPKKVPTETGLKICLGCFSPRTDAEICPICGYDFMEKGGFELEPGTIVNERYIIGKKEGAGSFGITYRAFDSKLQVKTAIKEFFPVTMAVRESDGKVTTEPEKQELFRKGCKTFLEEARVAARFNHKGIVSVKDFFEANSTAYLLMPFIDGLNLYDYIKRYGDKLSFVKTKEIFLPLFDALETLHKANFIHRDISPDNIFITNENEVKLLDFGSAININHQTSEKTGKHGFSPIEHYTAKLSDGYYSDIYALGATIFFALTGRKIPPAPDRIKNAEPLDFPNNLSRKAKKALLKALAPDYKKRYENIIVFRKELFDNSKPKFSLFFLGF